MTVLNDDEREETPSNVLFFPSLAERALRRALQRNSEHNKKQSPVMEMLAELLRTARAIHQIRQLLTGYDMETVRVASACINDLQLEHLSEHLETIYNLVREHFTVEACYALIPEQLSMKKYVLMQTSRLAKEKMQELKLLLFSYQQQNCLLSAPSTWHQHLTETKEQLQKDLDALFALFPQK